MADIVNNNFYRSKAIANNTVLLYLRMFIIMIINLYVIRLVFNILGEIDYGVFNVVGGIIIMLSCVSTVLSVSTQRYYSYAIGEQNFKRLKNVFSASLILYFILSLFVIIIGETIGLWIVNKYIVVPPERLFAANCIYQFSIISFVFSILQVPYSASVIAHEDIKIFAIISTLESVFKLFSALLLSIIPSDKLIYYGLFLMMTFFLSFLSYVIIARRKYIECHYKNFKDYSLFKELMSFSSWTLFGSLASMGMTQINTILINVFFGPIVNAARAISLSVGSSLNSFIDSFVVASKPAMIKSFAEQNFLYLNKIFYMSNKFIYYCLLIVCIPLFFEMNAILHLWLKTSNPQIVLFARLIVIYTIIMSLSNPIAVIIQATGHVKEYNIFAEFFTIMCVPATYIFYKLGYPAYIAFVVMIISAFLAHIVRLICLKKFYSYFNFWVYFRSFVIPAFLITVFSLSTGLLVHISITHSFVRLLCSVLSSLICVSFLTIFFGISREEKSFITKMICSFFKK